jgi:subtilisin family serine protease
MTERRIIANFFNDAARDKAREKMNAIEETESFLLGNIEDNDISYLQQQGIIVQKLDDSVPAETPGKVSQMKSREIATRNIISQDRSFDNTKTDSAPGMKTPDLSNQSEPNFYIVQLKGPLLEEWRKQIKNLGVEFLAHIPYNHYTAKLTPSQLESIKNLTFVSSVQLYSAEDTLIQKSETQETMRGAEVLSGTELKKITYDILLHQEDDLQNVMQWLQSHNVDIDGASRKKVRLSILDNPSLLGQISELPEVALIQEFVPEQLHNDISRVLLGIDSDSSMGTSPSPNENVVTNNLAESGEGEIVAIADSGIDDSHPDFNGRIVGISAWGRRDRNDHSDPIGHGTHVAGSVLGDGSASGGKFHGTAPKAKLFFQSLLDDQETLGGIPLNLADLFKEAYDAGARISSNSYGTTTYSVYRIGSMEIDDFVSGHRDMLIVRSAGNDGIAINPVNSQKGFVDWLSMGAPGTCKNGLTVGASRSSRTDGAYTTGNFSDFTWGKWQVKQQNQLVKLYPDPPIANERISGDPECMAAFSSRGPTDDHRIKPDVVAPGTDILSTRSSRAADHHFWGLYPKNEKYAFMGGTSMATPLISGCAALVREYYSKTRNHEPSAALLKATLVNSTKWLSGRDAVADHDKLPNYHQGFGFVYMPNAILPNKLAPTMKLEFIDNWKNQEKQLSRTGQQITYNISVSGGEYLRVCMAYTDVAGRGLQNNLNLFLLHNDSGRVFMGNQDLPFSLKNPDPDNNVEVIRISNPTPGKYSIAIVASNLLFLPQDFALVVSGDLNSPLTEIVRDS